MSDDHTGFYDRHVLPLLLDLACGIKPIKRQRQKILPRARGRVLEIGLGTGLNLPHYDAAKVDSIVGLDPATQMNPRAQKRMARSGLQVELLSLSAEEIPCVDDSFDTVVCTYTLCSIPEPLRALHEMKRVLRPQGELLFCEHGRAPDADVRRWQDRLDAAWGKIAGGCHLNRAVPELLDEAGFHSADMEQMYLPGPRPLTYNYWGSASA